MARIFIVEDHPVVRRGYVSFISRDPRMEICGEASSAQEALAALPAAKPDVVVLDVSLPGEMNGIDLLRELKQRYPKLLVLVVSGNEEAVYGEMVIRLGAWGYVMKGNVEEFMNSMRTLVDYVDGRQQKVNV